MKAWTVILVLLALAAAAAFGWHWLSLDPGYVVVRVHGTSIETTLVFAIAALLLLWAAIGLAWKLVRWPFGAWDRAMRRRGRERLANGLMALAEGRYAQAERDLGKAANHAALRPSALLGLARAAHARGAADRAHQALDAATAHAAPAALALRARFLLEHGKAGEALALLKPKAASGELSPLGWRELTEAALAAGDTRAAYEALTPLARSQALPAEACADVEARVLAATLAAAPNASQLDALWSDLGRARRQRPDVVAAYARRAAALGQTLAAMDTIESAERREWNEQLALSYGELGPAELPTRTRNAEGWLAIAPNSPALLTTLGRLCRDQSLWGKAEEYLGRSIAIAESPAAWEALGDCHAGRGDDKTALVCYANALHVLRGEAATPIAALGAHAPIDTRAVLVEERDEHGVPRLPQARVRT